MAKPVSTWQQKLTTAIKSDPKRSGVLAILLVVLLVAAGRAALGAKTPVVTKASAVTAKGGRTDNAREPRSANRRDGHAAMRRWLAGPAPKVNRNLFAAHIDHYPQLSGRRGKNSQNGTKDLSPEEKLNRLSADEAKERQTLTDRLQLEARQLSLTSTVTGATPKALINGQMVKEGDVVASGSGDSQASESGDGFRVLRIEARRVIIEREGIKLEILMN